MLKTAGHDVLTPQDANLQGQPDVAILAAAISDNRILLTRNCRDFCAEAQEVKLAGGHHLGSCFTT
jgi:predicted nuclease of predicted toxin-antitoxin system